MNHLLTFVILLLSMYLFYILIRDNNKFSAIPLIAGLILFGCFEFVYWIIQWGIYLWIKIN